MSGYWKNLKMNGINLCNMKVCKKCGKNKELTEYYNSKARKDGKQSKCKECCKEYRKVWYTEINPDYYWGKNGYFIKKYEENLEYQKDYRKADRNVKVYSLTLGDGSIYIGMTKRMLFFRMNEHRHHWRMIKNGDMNRSLSLYYKFIDEDYTDEQVQSVWDSLEILEDFPGTKYEGLKRERYWMAHYYKKGIQLVNLLSRPDDCHLPRRHKILKEYLNEQNNKPTQV